MRYILLHGGALALTLLALHPAAATAASAYTVKPSQVAIPQGAELGSYRRTIQPFANWDLICDEDLKAMTKVCNITQTIVDADGAMVFGWSLAAAEDGDPMMILRTAPDAVLEQPIEVFARDAATSITVPFADCSPSVCTALMSVGTEMQDLIARGSVTTIRYQTNIGELEVDAPLNGLREALLAIR